MKNLISAAFIFLIVFSCKQEQATTSILPDPYQAGWKGEKVCEVLEDNDELRVLRCSFSPGIGHDKHYHNPHLGYALVGGTFKIEEASGTREVSFSTGYSWSKDEVSEHQVLNIGDNTSVFLIIEYK
ncbi:MAG: quercetin dioxygenase-like cupin family protein [Glaciecola sp.]|jgi:quercetin dioxygenase-like cupin family protein